MLQAGAEQVARQVDHLPGGQLLAQELPWLAEVLGQYEGAKGVLQAGA